MRTSCKFKSMLPMQSSIEYHNFTPEGFRDAVARAKGVAKRERTSADVNLECGGKDIFLLTCPSSDKGATCDTRFSARPHGGLGGRKRNRRK